MCDYAEASRTHWVLIVSSGARRLFIVLQVDLRAGYSQWEADY